MGKVYEDEFWRSEILYRRNMINQAVRETMAPDEMAFVLGITDASPMEHRAAAGMFVQMARARFRELNIYG